MSSRYLKAGVSPKTLTAEEERRGEEALEGNVLGEQGGHEVRVALGNAQRHARQALHEARLVDVSHGHGNSTPRCRARLGWRRTRGAAKEKKRRGEPRATLG
jgi:hypothetical protein